MPGAAALLTVKFEAAEPPWPPWPETATALEREFEAELATPTPTAVARCANAGVANTHKVPTITRNRMTTPMWPNHVTIMENHNRDCVPKMRHKYHTLKVSTRGWN